MTINQPVNPTTDAMRTAQEDLAQIRISLRIPREVSDLPKAAFKAIGLLHEYGENLIGDEVRESFETAFYGYVAGSGLTNTYHAMRAGIQAVDAAIEAHNLWCNQERLRRRQQAEQETHREAIAKAKAKSPALRRPPTSDPRFAWLDRPIVPVHRPHPANA